MSESIISKARNFLNDSDAADRDEFAEVIDKAEDGDQLYMDALGEFMNRASDGQNPFMLNGIYTFYDILEECEENM